MPASFGCFPFDFIVFVNQWFHKQICQPAAIAGRDYYQGPRLAAGLLNQVMKTDPQPYSNHF